MKYLQELSNNIVKITTSKDLNISSGVEKIQLKFHQSLKKKILMETMYYYYTPGTVLGFSDGRVNVSYGNWNGDTWDRYGDWVENDDNQRVLLLGNTVFSKKSPMCW